ncbi:hypothetical protein AAF712_015178 [Marasmius tenuissimus]|uniref:Uncharacterized protein n=1 Tax=Marasmius tenuissimus TaxID=585030 RepID=A0ABR2ZB32_9AGAR
MAQTQSFGDTISSGIQDIAALLPLLGTEQCERHVGDALQKGYLYAAATPLSIFGSLGVVKTSFATFLATMTKPFYGGSWLQDAGFGTTGSVASMVTLVPGTKRYGAEVQSERLMKEQHIDNPEMILSIERFGWKKADEVGTGSLVCIFVSVLRRLISASQHLNLSWNLCLVLTSALASLVALVPYIYLAHSDKRNALAWVFPALRSFGSFVCVVSVQLALQLRIHHVTSSSLFLMKERHRRPLSIEESIREQDMLLESRLKNLPLKFSARRTSDLEKGPTSETQRGYKQGIPTPRSVTDLTLVALQVSLAVGMGMIVTGYVGCFNLVSQTNAKNGRYAWLAAEAALSLLRLFLWGSNPSWDEKDTGLTLSLGLLPKSPPAPMDTGERNCLDVHSDLLKAQIQQSLGTDHIFPFITSPHPLHLLTGGASTMYVGQDSQWRDSFVAHHVEDLLAAASPYVGPIGRIEVDGSSIYYAILAEVSHESSQILLCATVVPHAAGWNSLSFLLKGGKTQYRVFHCRTRHLADTRALEVAFITGSEGASTDFLDDKDISLIVDYSNSLLCQLVAPTDVNSHLRLPWSLTFPGASTSDLTENAVSLSHLHEEYMRIGLTCDLKGDHCLWRGNMMNGITLPNVDSARGGHAYTEYTLMFDSAMQETYLCIMEQCFVRRAGLSNALSRQLGLQWIQKMEARLTSEKLAAVKRNEMWFPSDPILQEYHEAWETLSSEIRLLRLLPANSPVLEYWENTLVDLMQFNRTPHILKLFQSNPINAVFHIRRYLFPYFTNDPSSSNIYWQDLVNFVRSSIQLLHSVKPPPYFGRIDPAGSGSPDFSPPYTSINLPLGENIRQALLAQIHSVEFLALTGQSTWEEVSPILHSFSTSPTRLTTLVLRDLQITQQTTSMFLRLLKKHRTLNFILFDSCPNYIGEDVTRLLTHAITRNHRRWRKNALKLCLPCYQIGLVEWREAERNQHGLELHSGERLYVTQGHDIYLRHEVAIVAMVHIPYHGRIIPILSAKPHTNESRVFVATLIQHRDNINSQVEVCSMAKEVEPLRLSEWNPVAFGAFPEVAPGCYKVQIHAEDTKQYIFKKLIIESAPTYRFQFSLHSPEGQHGNGTFVFLSQENTQNSRLKELSMVLSPLTGKLRLHNDWATLNNCSASGMEEAIDQHAVATQSEVDGSGGHPGSGEQEGQPQNSGEADEAMEQATFYLEANYHFSDGPSLNDSKPEFIPPPTYQFQFSLRSPEGHWHHRSFEFSPETSYFELENFTLVLDSLNDKLRVDRYWLDPSGGHAIRIAEEGIVQEYAAFDSNEIDVLFDPSSPREHEDQLQSSEEMPEESSDEASEEGSTGRRGAEDSQIPVVPSFHESVSP